MNRRRHVDSDEFYGLFGRVAPHGYNPFGGESTAWDIARSLPSATAIPVETRVAIERTYAEQDFLRSEGLHVVEGLHVTATDEHPNLFLPAVGIAIDSTDVVASEKRLLGLYTALLAVLPNR